MGARRGGRGRRRGLFVHVSRQTDLATVREQQRRHGPRAPAQQRREVAGGNAARGVHKIPARVARAGDALAAPQHLPSRDVSG